MEYRNRSAESDEMRKAIENYRKVSQACNDRILSTSERRVITPKGSTLYSVRRTK